MRDITIRCTKITTMPDDENHVIVSLNVDDNQAIISMIDYINERIGLDKLLNRFDLELIEEFINKKRNKFFYIS